MKSRITKNIIICIMNQCVMSAKSKSVVDGACREKWGVTVGQRCVRDITGESLVARALYRRGRGRGSRSSTDNVSYRRRRRSAHS